MLIFIICSDLYGRKDKKEKQWKASYIWVDELCVFACVCAHTYIQHACMWNCFVYEKLSTLVKSGNFWEIKQSMCKEGLIAHIVQ